MRSTAPSPPSFVTIVLLALGATACARDASNAFTRQSALEKARVQYPSAALPTEGLPSAVEARENLVYSRPDNQALLVDVYRPKQEGRYPAVLVVHGGGWASGERQMERPFAQQLATHGLVTVPVSYRLGESGRFPAALFDLKAAVRWLRAHADELGLMPTRIGAVGGSAGGHLALLLGATNGLAPFEGDGGHPEVSSEIQAVVSIDGLADFTAPELLEKERLSPAAPTRFLGGSYAERPEIWKAASPVTHLGPMSAKVLFLRSTALTPILPGREQACAKLATYGRDCQIVVIPETPHPFWLLEPWFAPTLEQAARFLHQHLR